MQRDQIEAMVERTVGRVRPGRRDHQQRADVPCRTRRSPTVDSDDVEVFYRSGVLGTLWAMQAVYPHMQEAGWGRIVNFGSSMGRVGGAGFGAYNASKEAIRGLSRTAAREWAADGIIVNIIAPAAAPPRAVGSEHYEEFMRTCPMGRNGDPELDIGADRALPVLRRLPLRHRPHVHGRRRQLPLVMTQPKPDWSNPWPVVGRRAG